MVAGQITRFTASLLFMCSAALFTFTVWIGSAAALRLDGTWGPGSQGGTAGMSDGGFMWLAQSSRIQAVG